MPYKDKKKQIKYQSEWMKKRRRAWLKENGPCKKCSSLDALEIDHIDPKDKVDHRVWSWTKKRKKKELKKCQVLCEKCHRKKTSKQMRKPIVHGTISAYHYRKCRCRPCVVTAYQYEKARKAKKNES